MSFVKHAAAAAAQASVDDNEQDMSDDSSCGNQSMAKVLNDENLSKTDKRMYETMQMYTNNGSPNADELTAMTYMNMKDVNDDWIYVEPSLPGVVKSYVEQEAEPGNQFDAEISGFTLTHLTIEMLNCIGKPITENKKNPFFGWLCVLPSAIPVCGNRSDRMTLPGREYNGVAVNVETGDLDVYRLDLNKIGVCEPMRLKLDEARAHFSMFVDDDELREFVLQQNNVRAVHFQLQHNPAGISVTARLPFVPAVLYTQFKSDAKKNAEKRKKQKAPDVVAPMKAPTGIVRKQSKPSASAPAPQTVDELVASIGKTDASLASSAINEKKAFKEPVAAAAATVPTKSAGAKRKRGAGGSAGGSAPPTPGAFGGAERQLAKEFEPEGYKVVKLYVPYPYERLAPDSEYTLGSILSHFSAKIEDGFVTQNPFVGKKTYGSVVQDVNSRYAVQATISVLQNLAPHALGLGSQPEIPSSLPLFTSDEMY